ncbi:hypothetical protein Bsp3421_004947 [Burkholderia sp. FERM BP-3421]|nr:hypothetical protein [Burkholderia sp. FERM BP-3421]WDD94803.1 hypothetical protein Bsp3421_004947 [Burkholderia sp. FERM BP-3421]
MRARRLHVARAAHAPVVVAMQRGARQVGHAARFVVAALRQADAERCVEPGIQLSPADPEQPGQAEEQQHDHRERRADVAEHALEAAREQLAERVAGGVAARQRGAERATRDHHREETQPQPDRTGARQTAAARQHGFDETPEKRDEPDGREAEPA